ncbi:TonB-dependent receptor [Alkalilimnicola ehrlichii]|uniref:TonB-dependent receptor n=1 Tax=Alkalilimnicola ehrlichii TaxID=351052 RepID=UPI0011C06715|nr:TonB-dependent receptor [Alkalilimnicola ehrlichii]
MRRLALMRGAHCLRLASLFAVCLAPLGSVCAEPSVLPTLLITGPGDSGHGVDVALDATGQYSLDRRALEHFGGPTGHLTDVLGILPNVQFGESAQEAERLYDLRPASISISGGRPYDNTFILDGVSIDSRLDPAGNAHPTAVNDVPGHDQALFVDLDLVEEIKVFDSNVPAAYSGFTGGVVDARTRRAGLSPQTRLRYSTTRGDWVNYHVITARPSAYEPDPEPPAPPEFKRERLGLSHSRPLGEASSLVTSFNRSYSKTPDILLGQSAHRTQESYNALVKYSLPVGPAYWDTSLAVAPFRSTNFISNAKDSDFTLRGGGFTVSSALEWETGHHEGRLRLGLGMSENSRRAPRHFYEWENTPSRNWGRQADLASSRAGGFGDLDKRQHNASLNLQLQRRPLYLGSHRFTLDYGGEARFNRLQQHRLQTTYNHRTAVVNTDIQCRGISRDCVQNEQYFAIRNVHEAEDVTVSLWQSGLFAEGSWEYRRLSATLGLRYDYDDFLRNHDIAHRSRAQLDVFGHGGTRVFVGHNRYYGTGLLTYKLREASKPHYREYRSATHNVVNDWELDSGRGNVRYVFDGLRTPYSDEISTGIRQRLFGGIFELKYIERDNRDGFARTVMPIQEDGYRWYMMNNEGRSEYRSLAGGWNRRVGSTTVGVSATWSESRSSNQDYDSRADDSDPDEWVWYNGRRVQRGELTILSTDFNRPLTASFRIAHQFSEQLSVSFVNRYRGRYTNIAETSATTDGEQITLPDGSRVNERLTVFEDRERKPTWHSNLNIQWSVGAFGVDASINNLFNQRSYSVNEQQGGVEVGRNYWLGASANF